MPARINRLKKSTRRHCPTGAIPILWKKINKWDCEQADEIPRPSLRTPQSGVKQSLASGQAPQSQITGLPACRRGRLRPRLGRRLAMTFRLGSLVFLAISFVLPCFITGIEASEKTKALGAVKIAATIFPLADIAQHIASSEPMGFRAGGPEDQVITILPAGANPHTFELTPQAVKELEGARIIFMIGHGFDDWVKAIGESLPNAETFAVDNGIDLEKPGGEDPHYWLSIANAKLIAKNMARALTELKPERKDQYERNLVRYLEQLDETDSSIREMFSDLPERKIITFHDGWRYFARDYGLEMAGNIEPSGGGEATPKRLTHLADVIRDQKIKVLFSEPAVSKTVAESVAGDFHLRLYELDPFGGSGNRKSFLDLMKANAHTIHEALSHGSR